MVEYWPYTGHVTNLRPALNRARGQYARYCREFKIGLTHDPEERWRAYKSDGWDKMIVLYSTRALNNAAKAESLLIEGGWNASYYRKCLNKIPGGTGSHPGFPSYYVYIVIWQ